MKTPMREHIEITENIQQLEAILTDWQDVIGAQYQAYRNHVYRMIHCCFALQECNEEDQQKIIIAAAFHDIGIWIENTLDYIPPSIPPAIAHLRRHGLESWSEEISLMISEHHKLRRYKDKTYPLVELFRKGDLVDFSLGLFKSGIDKAYIKSLKATFPNAGFHKFLIRMSVKRFFRHPLNPAPMMKW